MRHICSTCLVSINVTAFSGECNTKTLVGSTSSRHDFYGKVTHSDGIRHMKRRARLKVVDIRMLLQLIFKMKG